MPRGHSPSLDRRKYIDGVTRKGRGKKGKEEKSVNIKGNQKQKTLNITDQAYKKLGRRRTEGGGEGGCRGTAGRLNLSWNIINVLIYSLI